jgi:FixJ family two-component response regulator
MTKTTIHVIEDDEELRLSLDSLLRSVGFATQLYKNALDFRADALPDEPACLVVDVRLPGLSGLDFQDQLIRNGTPIPVVMMTGYGDVPMTVRAMKAGAIDFLPKPFRDQDMLDAVAAGIDRDRRRRESDGGLSSLKRRLNTLSERERQVMAMVTSGLMNKQIAGHLSISEVTVKIHRRSAMQKMEAKTLADLIKMSESLRLGERVTSL